MDDLIYFPSDKVQSPYSEIKRFIDFVKQLSELNEDIKKLGKDKFKFEIIKFCTCKWELSYFEAKAQFEEDVLFKQDEYYNGIINLRIGRSPKESLEKFNLCQSNLKSGI